jgi:hypothetical protein
MVSLAHQASFLKKRSLPVPIRWEAGWTSELVWRMWKRGKSLASAVNRIPVAWMSCPKTSGCTGQPMLAHTCQHVQFLYYQSCLLLYSFFYILPNMSISKLLRSNFFKLVCLIMVWIEHLHNVPSPPLKQKGHFVFAHERRFKRVR